ncbi:MAG: hypothetical protein WC365_07620 [Candidatus Babeliales bacterium]
MLKIQGEQTDCECCGHTVGRALLFISQDMRLVCMKCMANEGNASATWVTLRTRGRKELGYNRKFIPTIELPMHGTQVLLQ